MSADTIVRAIEAEHGARCRAVQAAYEAEMAPHRLAFSRIENAASAKMRAALSEHKAWRVRAIRAVQSERHEAKSTPVAAE